MCFIPALLLIHINERTCLPIFRKCGTPAEQYFFNWTLSTCTQKYPVIHYTVDPSSRIYVMVTNILDQSTCCAFRTIRTTNPSPYWIKFCTLAEQYWWLILILVYFITPRGSLLYGPNKYFANMLHLTFRDELGRKQKDTFTFYLKWVDACYFSWFQNGLRGRQKDTFTLYLKWIETCIH